MNKIAQNYKSIISNVDDACKKSGRSVEEITIVAASKTQKIESIESIHNLGINNFGENRLQELEIKAPQLKNVKWHFIGNIQTNKLKKIATYANCIHSIDSEKQIEILSNLEKIPSLFIQFSYDGDEKRGGVSKENISKLIDHAHTLGIYIDGLMCVPPINVEPKAAFELAKNIAQKHNLKQLSMGMSSDYISAIECGSTIIRLGSVLFGARDYQ